MAESADHPLRIAMFTPWHERCGVRDYSAHLIDALDGLPQIDSVRIVAPPQNAARAGLAAVLRHRSADAERFRRLGEAMNLAADAAHIQHQYFLFGGVSPHRSHVTSFLDRITVPAVMTVHEIAAEPPRWPQREAVRAANRLNFLHPVLRAHIVHTEADRGRLKQIGVDEPRIHVVRHGVPPALPLPDPERAREMLSAAYREIEGRRIVTLFGFLSNKKGHMTALEALAQLPEEIALVFAGDRHPDDHTDYVARVRMEMVRLGVSHRTVITGYLTPEQVAAIMAITDVAIAPYSQTSGSGSLANLLAYGRAIIASGIEPHRELLAANPGLLVLVPAHRPDLLAAEISALLENDSRRDRLRKASLVYAVQNTYLEMAKAVVRVYQGVVGRRMSEP